MILLGDMSRTDENLAQGSASGNRAPWLRTAEGANLLGTDGLGRDLLSRILHGARLSLGSASLAAVLMSLIGLVVGTVAGYGVTNSGEASQVLRQSYERMTSLLAHEQALRGHQLHLTDPSRADEGFLVPIGGHKGSGLTMAIGLLAGTLNGAAFGRAVVDHRVDPSVRHACAGRRSRWWRGVRSAKYVPLKTSIKLGEAGNRSRLRSAGCC